MGAPINTAPPPATNTPPRDIQKDKLNTLFVGAIAAGISDDWIETLLKVKNKKEIIVKLLNPTNN